MKQSAKKLPHNRYLERKYNDIVTSEWWVLQIFIWPERLNPQNQLEQKKLTELRVR